MDGVDIRPVRTGDGSAVVAIFNHWIVEGFAAYLEQPVDLRFFEELRRRTAGYPLLVAERDGEVVGFGLLSSYHPASTFRRTGVLTYFLRPDATGQRIGSRMLDRLVVEARALGIDTLLAHISSRNPGSLRFHERHGFEVVGRFERIGIKRGQDFGVVWVRRALA